MSRTLPPAQEFHLYYRVWVVVDFPQETITGFGPPIFTRVVLTKHGNTGYVITVCLRFSTPPSKNDIEKNKNDNEKILTNVKNFSQKLAPCRESNSGSLRWLRASVPLLLITAGHTFPVSTISATGHEKNKRDIVRNFVRGQEFFWFLGTNPKDT